MKVAYCKWSPEGQLVSLASNTEIVESVAPRPAISAIINSTSYVFYVGVRGGVIFTSLAETDSCFNTNNLNWWWDQPDNSYYKIFQSWWTLIEWLTSWSMLGFDNYLSKMLAAAVKTRQKGKNYRCSIKLQWVASHLGLWSPSGTPSGYWSPIFQDLKFLFFFFCNIQGRKNEFKVRDFDYGPIGFNWFKFCFYFDKWFHSDCC